MITSTGGTATLTVGDVLDLRDAAAYLGRLLRLDGATVVRLRSAGSLVALFAQPTAGIVAMRTMDVVGAPGLDRVVGAAELVAALRRADAERTTDVPLPAARDAEWVGTLPTPVGWSAAAVVPGEAVEAILSTGDPGSDRDALTMELDGAQVGVPMRLFATARTLGFLAPDDPVELRANPAWLSLEGTFGSVFARRPVGLAAFGLTPR